MFSEDYILRIIRQAASFLAAILRLKKTGQYEEALKQVDQALTLLVGVDADLVRNLDDEGLFRLISNNDEIDLEKLWRIVDVFREEGEIHELQGQKQNSIDDYTRSLNYYLTLFTLIEKPYRGEIISRIRDMLKKLDLSTCPENILWVLYSYYEEMGEYSNADRTLWDLAGRNHMAAQVVEEIKTFCSRLLAKSAQELAAGGMTNAFIQNRLREVNTQ